MSNKTAVVIPLSGDPITKGHRNMVEQLIERHPDKKKIVAIGKNIDKKGLFTTEEKIDMIKHDLQDLIESGEIEVTFYE